MLYPVDLIFTRLTSSTHLLCLPHPRTEKISSSEFKMYHWLIKGVLIECSELGSPFTECTRMHGRTHRHTTQSQRQCRVHQGRRAWGVSCQSKKTKESAHPPNKMGFLDHIVAYCGSVRLCIIQSLLRYLCLTAGECNAAQIASLSPSLTVCIVLMRGGI